MQTLKALRNVALAVWSGTALAQAEAPLDFGDRFNAISLSTWFWMGVFILFGIALRFGIDYRSNKEVWNSRYIYSTSVICAACGFFGMAATEYYIVSGTPDSPHNLNQWVQAAIIVAFSINSDVVLARIKRMISGKSEPTTNEAGP